MAEQEPGHNRGTGDGQVVKGRVRHPDGREAARGEDRQPQAADDEQGEDHQW